MFKLGHVTSVVELEGVITLEFLKFLCAKSECYWSIGNVVIPKELKQEQQYFPRNCKIELSQKKDGFESYGLISLIAEWKEKDGDWDEW